MKSLLILIADNGTCKALLTDSAKPGLDKCVCQEEFPLQHGMHSWSRLFSEVHDKLKLDTFAPPGMPTESGSTCRDPLQVWEVRRCGTPAAPGWGWGFMLPFDAKKQPVPTDTCCGFRDQEAAARAAKTMKYNIVRTTGDLPGGVFEIFTLDGVHAFFDPTGEIHATFPTHAEARGCAAKIEAALSQQPLAPQA